MNTPKASALPPKWLTVQCLGPDERSHYLHALSQARYEVLSDAENLLIICHVLEELGRRITGTKSEGLGQYVDALVSWVTPERRDRCARHLERVRQARNDAAHQGIYARNAALKAVLVCLDLEEVIRQAMAVVEDIMVGGVVVARPFMTLAKVREEMLVSSFSYLPLEWEGQWFLIADYELATLWHQLTRKARESQLLTEFLHPDAAHRLTLIPAPLLPASTPLEGLVVGRPPGTDPRRQPERRWDPLRLRLAVSPGVPAGAGPAGCSISFSSSDVECSDSRPGEAW